MHPLSCLVEDLHPPRLGHAANDDTVFLLRVPHGLEPGQPSPGDGVVPDGSKKRNLRGYTAAVKDSQLTISTCGYYSVTSKR